MRPPMSIVANASTLASRRATVLIVVDERMYGRVERTSSRGAPGSGSAATRRSYLPDHRDNRIRPVLERVLLDHATAQLDPGGRSCGGRGVHDVVQHAREALDVAGACEQLQRKSPEERCQRGVGSHDRTRAGRRLVDGRVKGLDGPRLV